MIVSSIVSGAATVTDARLLIHAGAGVSAKGSQVESSLQRLRTRLSMASLGGSVPLKIRVEDLQGKRFHAIDGAGSVTEISLPAGTYQVTAMLGELRRSYTLTLAPGALLDLYLRFPVWQS